MKNWLWVWCMINTLLVGMMGICFGLYDAYDDEQDEYIEALEHRCDILQAQIDDKNDSIIININLKK